MRIVQACRKLGLEFVCVHTAEDIHSGHVRIAKELGGEKSLYQVSSYHDANEILSVADDAGATAIHPGYGFFAEDFRFARRVTTRERKLIFIGPSWRVIRELGDKINTKRLARSLGVPTDESYEIPTEFDPNLALAIIWGENLEQAKERGMQFLDELTLQGENQSGELKSNVNFLRANTGRILRF